MVHVTLAGGVCSGSYMESCGLCLSVAGGLALSLSGRLGIGGLFSDVQAVLSCACDCGRISTGPMALRRFPGRWDPVLSLGGEGGVGGVGGPRLLAERRSGGVRPLNHIHGPRAGRQQAWGCDPWREVRAELGQCQIAVSFWLRRFPKEDLRKWRSRSWPVLGVRGSQRGEGLGGGWEVTFVWG
jgi:hypothetical protein